LKTIRLNRCPVVVTEKLLDEKIAQRWQIDRVRCEASAQKLLGVSTLAAKLRDVFVAAERKPITDPEQMLYSGGFFSDADRATMTQVRKAKPKELVTQNFVFEDKRLPEILLRYRARNFPETLSSDERADWIEFCRARLTDRSYGASIVLDEFRARLSELSTQTDLSEKQRQVLHELAIYAEAVPSAFERAASF
jgi:exodeoxyribonuclease-1